MNSDALCSGGNVLWFQRIEFRMADGRQLLFIRSIALGKPRWQILSEKSQHFGLCVLRAALGDENLIWICGIDAPLLGELEIERVIDLDPVREVERLQPDLE